jgi:hypothetical protein
MLKNEPDPALVQRQGAAVAAINFHGSIVGKFKARQDAKQRGLAGTGWAQQSDELFVLDLKIDAIEHGQMLEALGQILHRDFQWGCSLWKAWRLQGSA